MMQNYFFLGVCGCTGGFLGVDCSLDAASPPVVDPTSVHLVCPGICQRLTIIGMNYIQGAKCKFTSISVSRSFIQVFIFFQCF